MKLKEADPVKMSSEHQELVFESFLKKRRDKMKLKWVTYWFKLQNATLFFYSKKDGSALRLKGLYYMHMVESLHDIKKRETKRYAFEITMRNGKKKLLAAESADLRQSWMEFLRKAMQLSGSGRPESTCWHDISDLKGSGHDSCDSDGGKEMSVEDLHASGRNDIPGIQEDLQEDNIYDVPLSNKRANEDHLQEFGDMRESIYDVPPALLRKLSEQRLERSSEGPTENWAVLYDNAARFSGEAADYTPGLIEGSPHEMCSD